MEPYRPADVVPQLVHVLYWDRKERFLNEIDVYPSWVMFAVCEGIFDFRIGQLQGSATSGDIVLCPPGIPLWREVVRTLSFFVIHFRWKLPDSLQTIEDESLLMHIPRGKLTLRDSRRMSSSYQYLLGLWPKRDKLHRRRQNLLLNDIWLQYCLEAEAARNMEKPSDPLMQKAASLLEARAYDSRFSMKNLSAELELSPVQFTRRFKARFGKTPADYVVTLRMDKVRQMLLETNYPLDQIAEQCGYENGFYLSRVFSKKFEMSPSVYRSTHQM
ncbi:helix-turn-helix transcriptional regulator [Paenibacillus mesophilus]|uniref:helix-turn-helix domain-containing protein n=1 Tax=Paenibacillus mesophilus TaxID=2582849 RepID=UPI00110F5E47|nr:AraC family transcriptional regulator [Paenibacillus mesophilus]TMV44695.1 helix-turn-helix transcriptional regulator [Paenibacillus mesophilus]